MHRLAQRGEFSPIQFIWFLICSHVVSPHREGQVQAHDPPCCETDHRATELDTELSNLKSPSLQAHRVLVNSSSQITLISVERHPLHVEWNAITLRTNFKLKLCFYPTHK